MAKNRRFRSKLCSNCGIDKQVLFRVKTIKNINWVFVCPSCLTKFKCEENYQYGGTWKAVKRN